MVLAEFLQQLRGDAEGGTAAGGDPTPAAGVSAVRRVREELLSAVEEARRDAQPDIQALAAAALKLLVA